MLRFNVILCAHIDGTNNNKRPIKAYHLYFLRWNMNGFYFKFKFVPNNDWEKQENAEYINVMF